MLTPTESLTESFTDKFIGLSADNLLRWAAGEFDDSLVVTTSFGIQSAVTLRLATSVKPNIKVVWVDTGYLPDETYAYATTLIKQLNLNIQVYESSVSPAEMEAQHGRLWESNRVEDLNLYDQIRKVEPMQRALEELNVRGWVSGLRASQTEFRKRLPPLKRSGSQFRIHPILDWTNRDVFYFMQEHDLPQHPLFHKGYATVGDSHSSRPFDAKDSSERDTRFRGLKQECGLHTF